MNQKKALKNQGKFKNSASERLSEVCIRRLLRYDEKGRMLFQSCYNRIDARFEGLLSIVECSLLVGYTSGYTKRRMDENLLICKGVCVHLLPPKTFQEVPYGFAVAGFFSRMDCTPPFRACVVTLGIRERSFFGEMTWLMKTMTTRSSFPDCRPTRRTT